MVMLKGMAIIHLILEEVAVYAGHLVLMEVVDNSALISGDLLGILGLQLRYHSVHLLNIVCLLITNENIRY